MDNNETLIVLDTETTGLDYKREKIIEFAAIKLVNNEIVDEFEVLINPEQEIRKSSMNVHGITQEMVDDQPAMSEVMPKILDFIQDYPIIGHNVIFDYNFLNQASLTLYDKELSNTMIDTQLMFKEVFPDELSHGLDNLISKFNVTTDVRHRAMGDTKPLAQVYPKLKELYYQKYAWQIAQLQNMGYLFERYLRVQQTVQTLHAEMADIKSVFKVYFERGGQDLTASTGEILTCLNKQSFNYDVEQLKPILEEIGATDRALKVNTHLIDRMIDGTSLSDEIKERLNACRIKATEKSTVSVVKPEKVFSSNN